VEGETTVRETTAHRPRPKPTRLGRESAPASVRLPRRLRFLVSIVVVALAASLAAAATPAQTRSFTTAAATPPYTQSLTTAALLDTIQHTAFNFFWLESNTFNGLIRDRSTTGSPCSIASLGFGLSAICVGIDHGWVTRAAGQARVLTALQTLWNGTQGPAASGIIGYKGLYYHFLDIFTAVRTWDSELSTIDTALLFAGVVDTKQYFGTADPGDVQVRALADSIYYRADWDWARGGTNGLRMGWKPPGGFNGFGTWIGYNEAMIMYLLALGSPTHPVPSTVWTTWTSGYQWGTLYGYQYVHFPPLFGHQYSHCWIDFRDIWDAYMQAKGITYFENSRRATLAQRAYCIANPSGRVGYSADLWGLTASDDPFGYSAHGAPPGQNDNGTLTPTAPISSIAFSPAECLQATQHLWDTYRTQLWSPYGFKDAFNPGFTWFDTDVIGIDQGPIILMIENYRTQSVWNRFMQNADVQRGLQRAGFVASPPSDVDPGTRDRTCAIEGNSPNPMRGLGEVRFRLPATGRVTIALYDASGRRVRQLFDGVRPAGPAAVPFDATGIPSGVYFYRLDFRGQQRTQRCVILH
jgi:hypothetical protein